MKHIYGIFRDTDHSLIYVGITRNPESRMNGHRVTTFAGSEGPHYMEILESSESLTVEDEHFWISYMASLGCVLLNRVGITPHRSKAPRTALELEMRRQRIRPEKLAVLCNMPLGSVRLAIKGIPIKADRARRISKVLGISQDQIPQNGPKGNAQVLVFKL